jgi:hypothetical protein
MVSQDGKMNEVREPFTYLHRFGLFHRLMEHYLSTLVEGLEAAA